MARPRKIADEAVLAAAGDVVARLGPAFTLADVAAAAGVSAGTVVHRFGSKHGLLLAMMDAAVDAAQPDPAAQPNPGARQRPRAADPVAAVRDAVIERYAPLDDASAAPNNLAQLGTELADGQLRGRLGDLYAAVEAGLVPLLDAAVAAGRLPGAPPAPMAARILAALADGTAMRWSTRPHGRLRQRLRTDLDAVLAGWGRPHLRHRADPT